VLGIAMIILSVWLMVKPSERISWIVFKFSSPYLAALFIAFVVDAGFH
jgi:protoheme IX farnesyltransferase